MPGYVFVVLCHQFADGFFLNLIPYLTFRDVGYLVLGTIDMAHYGMPVKYDLSLSLLVCHFFGLHECRYLHRHLLTKHDDGVGAL